MLNSTLYYTMLTKNYSEDPGRCAAIQPCSVRPPISRPKSARSKRSTIYVDNSKLYNYVMTAFGLGDMTYAKGLIRKVLEGGVSSSTKLANTLNDPRYKALATAFNFAANGAATTSSASLQQTTISNFDEQTLETNVGKTSPGAQMALYFQRMAPSISSAYNILGDKTVLKVVQTAFGLSPSMSQQGIDQQAQTIGSSSTSPICKSPPICRSHRALHGELRRQQPLDDIGDANQRTDGHLAGHQPEPALSIAALPQGGL